MQMRTKATLGRGHKCSDWILWLYPTLFEAFEYYKRIGVKFSYCLLLELVNTILLAPDFPCTIHSCNLKDNVLLTQKLIYSWRQQFMHVHNIVLLSQRGRLTCSPAKELQIERSTICHLGVLKRGFKTSLFDENLMENIDKTHFVVNMDNSRTLMFRGETPYSLK